MRNLASALILLAVSAPALALPVHADAPDTLATMAVAVAAALFIRSRRK